MEINNLNPISEKLADVCNIMEEAISSWAWTFRKVVFIVSMLFIIITAALSIKALSSKGGGIYLLDIL